MRLRPVLLCSAAFLAATAALAQSQLPSALVPSPPASTGDAVATAPPPTPASQPPVAAPPPAPVTTSAPAAGPVDAAPIAPLAPADPPPPATVSTVAAPTAVVSSSLSAPDLFAADAGQRTGLPSNLWNGASADLARIVLPLVGSKPLSPAAAAFAHRLLTTGAAAPDGAGQDADLAAMRINAVLALGDPMGARVMLEHTPGVRQSAALAQVAVETDLLLGREDEACSLGDNLAAGKDNPYFRRLRAYCLYKAGDKPGAQLAYDLTAEQAKDEVYKRLMGSAVSGAPAGQASLRNGIEYALSKRLNLDLAPALPTAWSPVVTAVAQDPTTPQPLQAAAAALVAQRQADVSRASTLDPTVRDAALSLSDNKLSPELAERLAAAGRAGSPQAQQGLALYAAAGAPGGSRVRAVFAGFDLGPSRGSQARLMELDAVSAGGAKGDAALLALWLAADAGAAGPTPVDRARIARAINRAGFGEDARSYALEGMLNLGPPPAPPPAAAAPKAAAKPVAKKPPPRKRGH